MAALTMSVTMERRAAKVTLNEWFEKKYGIAAGTHDCHVLGLFQYTDGDEASPIFVVELKDGRVIEVSTKSVQFVDIAITGRNAKGEPMYD